MSSSSISPNHSMPGIFSTARMNLLNRADRLQHDDLFGHDPLGIRLQSRSTRLECALKLFEAGSQPFGLTFSTRAVEAPTTTTLLASLGRLTGCGKDE